MSPLTYRKSGVNIDEADDFIRLIKPMVRTTTRPEVLAGIGGFSALVAPRLKGMKTPVLVSSTDGVGTKLMIADLLNKYDTVGIDLVAMSVDDVVVTGAEPLFFLDYIACGKLDKDHAGRCDARASSRAAEKRIAPWSAARRPSFPGLYAKEQWDLAGFCVGVVDKGKIIDGRRCRSGDKVIGLASSGLHSNGFSLARKVFTEKELKGRSAASCSGRPGFIRRTILSVMKKIRIKAMAHITGGGFYDNIPRVIPNGLGVRVWKAAWPIPPIFRLIQERGKVAEREMFRTLNMGIGMVVVVAASDARRTLALFRKLGQKAWVIGELFPGPHAVVIF